MKRKAGEQARESEHEALSWKAKYQKSKVEAKQFAQEATRKNKYVFLCVCFPR
jgi:hypothetical protein